MASFLPPPVLPQTRAPLSSRFVYASRPYSSPPSISLSADKPCSCKTCPTQTLISLCTSRGALGRGSRAILLAFHRRASFLAASHTVNDSIYVEIGPAYVLATSRYRTDRVTRYAVEQKAWPMLKEAMKWEETSTTEARKRGARLRRLHEGGRYGRHVFVRGKKLRAMVSVAEGLMGDDEAEMGEELIGGGRVEAIVELRKRPVPGGRTVAVRCPRWEHHANADRNPSVILWMNKDGVTGGGMCSVCRDADGFVTWRVVYGEGGEATLCTPWRRVKWPIRVAEVMSKIEGEEKPVEKDESKEGPVGGQVMKRVGDVGGLGLAYVTASLRIGSEVSVTGEEVWEKGGKQRTTGTMAKQGCPMKVLLWSDRRSKGPQSKNRVSEVAWFAKQMEEEAVESEEWLATPLVSVSMMRPSGWREVTSANGRVVSVVKGWEPSGQGWVLFDVDDIGLGNEEMVRNVAKRMSGVVRREREFSGKCLIMRTGPKGLHVWGELREMRVEPGKWFRKPDVRTWYKNVGERLLKAGWREGGVGGSVDMSSCAAGRWARRPGWRLLEDGREFRSAVVLYVPSRVRSRTIRNS